MAKKAVWMMKEAVCTANEAVWTVKEAAAVQQIAKDAPAVQS